MPRASVSQGNVGGGGPAAQKALIGIDHNSQHYAVSLVPEGQAPSCLRISNDADGQEVSLAAIRQSRETVLWAGYFGGGPTHEPSTSVTSPTSSVSGLHLLSGRPSASARAVVSPQPDLAITPVHGFSKLQHSTDLTKILLPYERLTKFLLTPEPVS